MSDTRGEIPVIPLLDGGGESCAGGPCIPIALGLAAADVVEFVVVGVEADIVGLLGPDDVLPDLVRPLGVVLGLVVERRVALALQSVYSVYRFIGVWQQESSQRPQ